MPKVLRIINRFNLGGPTFNAAYLTKYLEPEYETLLIGGTHELHEESSEFIVSQLGVKYMILPEMRRSINYLNDIKTYNIIRRLIKDFKPDIVHTHAAKAGALGRYAAYKLNVPVIIHTFHGHVFHSYFSSYKTAVFKNIERYLANRSSRIIAISEIQKYELSQIHGICLPEKVEVIPLGFDLSKFQVDVERKRRDFRKNYLLKDDEVAVGIIGRLVPVKNHTLFINALKYIKDAIEERTTKHEERIKYRVFIIGDGNEKQNIQNLSTNLGLAFSEIPFECQALNHKLRIPNPELQTNIIFTSWIKNIDEALAGLDIVALTSLNEGTPVSLIEAQAAGKPIVSTNVGGIENVVIPGRTALLSEVGDVKTFGDNLLRLIEDANLRNELSASGWKHVEAKFHYTRLVSDMKRLYDSLL